MVTLYESYNDNSDDTSSGYYSVFWVAQTFLTTIEHTISAVKLKLTLVRGGGIQQPIIISIRATDVNGHPSGPDLTSTSIDGTMITATDWYNIALPELSISKNTMYAIVVRSPTATITNYSNWRSNSSSSTYSNGKYENSIDSGVTWIASSTLDFQFEIWGNPIVGTLKITRIQFLTRGISP
jgi:hypothetical protein